VRFVAVVEFAVFVEFVVVGLAVVVEFVVAGFVVFVVEADSVGQTAVVYNFGFAVGAGVVGIVAFVDAVGVEFGV
jgi:hypothetical protein